MLEDASSSGQPESTLIAGNSRLSPDDLENVKRLQEKQKNQVQQKNSQQNKPALDKPVEEKKTDEDFQEACECYERERRLTSAEQLCEAIYEGVVMFLAQVDDRRNESFELVSHRVGAVTGARAMKRIAVPMVGGLFSTTLSTLIVLPAIYFLWRQKKL